MPLLLEWGKITFFLCTCSRNCIIIIVSVVVVVMFQNCQVIATSLGCCWCSAPTPPPQNPGSWSSCNIWWKMGAGG